VLLGSLRGSGDEDGLSGLNAQPRGTAVATDLGRGPTEGGSGLQAEGTLVLYTSDTT